MRGFRDLSCRLSPTSGVLELMGRTGQTLGPVGLVFPALWGYSAGIPAGLPCCGNRTGNAKHTILGLGLNTLMAEAACRDRFVVLGPC